MSTAREDASSALDELEQYVQRLEREWNEARERHSDLKKQYQQLPEDDEDGFAEITSEVSGVWEHKI